MCAHTRSDLSDKQSSNRVWYLVVELEMREGNHNHARLTHSLMARAFSTFNFFVLCRLPLCLGRLRSRRLCLEPS